MLLEARSDELQMQFEAVAGERTHLRIINQSSFGEGDDVWQSVVTLLACDTDLVT